MHDAKKNLDHQAENPCDASEQVFDLSQMGALRGAAMVRAGNRLLPVVRLGLLKTFDEYIYAPKLVLFCRPVTRDKRRFRHFASEVTQLSQSGKYKYAGLCAEALDVCPKSAPARSWVLRLVQRGYMDREASRFIELNELLLRVDTERLEIYEQQPPGPIRPSKDRDDLRCRSIRTRLKEIPDLAKITNYGELHIPRNPKTKPLRFFGLYAYGQLFSMNR